jgi:neutral trehalase
VLAIHVSETMISVQDGFGWPNGLTRILLDL